MADNSTNHHPKVILPRDQTSVNGSDVNDANYNLTVDHALRYQKLLANRAGTNLATGPLMTKRLREQKEGQDSASAQAAQSIDYLYIRARLPDRTALDYQLSVTSTLHSLYETIRGSLIETAAAQVSVSLSSPFIKLKDDDTVTLLDAGFSKKTLVLVEVGDCSPPYLKPHLLANAKAYAEQQQKEQKIQENSGGESIAEGPKPTRKLTKAPKWLKLSKK
ncbi:Ubx4p [Kluyveromyces lactis]|uniref:KLLA0F26026p n=1 Tax=Kluyveromyces lactis (strain ATCC 8585 / CBS 2359 / DSM 70799 / NBRC 1267 / NRRL Y-1140 / WM37) TaxID=284590 RepID=Q6CIK0_KLULA|nr:uncharacterized protein KLLA0_F26026g [Kluyveromyces lactis]CAG98947.1 KLLA0F26026p [Kluyveromyces lactis]|eukprot:XP_456239.1 uncharacterized protein KLLA0_F26026g [Kluyveromyces lactis]